MNGNPRVILTGALLAAGAAGIITSVAALLTTAITILGPKLIGLRAQQQLGKDIRWLMTHNQEGTSTLEIATLLKNYQEKVLQAHVAAITAAHAQTKEPNTSKSRRSSAATS